jgi:hypothetical protein
MAEFNGSDWRERMDRFNRGIELLLQSHARHEARLKRLDAGIENLF